MTNKIVVLDPGHGGSDPGAVGNGLLEKVLTLEIAKRTERYLETYFTGVTVLLTRDTDKTLSLNARTAFANAKKADYIASIHINAGGGTGYEDHIYNGGVGSGTVSAQNTIHSAIMAEIKDFGANIKDRGKKRSNFHMVRESNMEAILTENLFIDDLDDAKLLKNSVFLDALAKGHAIGIGTHLKLAKKTVQAAPTKPAPTTKKEKDTHRVIVDGKQIGAFSDDVNVLNEVAKALKSPAKKISIEEV